MAYTISTHNGTSIAWEHNYSKKFRDKEEHIDSEQTIDILEYSTLKDKYHELFDKAIDDYNNKQKRKDRRIEDYYVKISKDKQKNVAYEMIIQVGNYNNKPTKEQQEKILKEFYQNFKECFPNMEVVACVLHKDESTYHLHLDYIPIKHSKKGLETQVSMTGALSEMGYTNSDKFYEQPLIKWTKDCNQLLEDICNKYGLEIEHPEREKSEELKQKHFTIKEYRDNKTIENLEAKNRELAQKYKHNVEVYNNNVKSMKNAFETKKEAFTNNIKEMQEETNKVKEEANKAKQELEKYKDITTIPNVQDLKSKGSKSLLGKKTYSELDLEQFFEDYKALSTQNYNLTKQNEEYLHEITNLKYQKDFVNNELGTQKNNLDYYKNKNIELNNYKKFYDYLKNNYDISSIEDKFLMEQSKNKNIDKDFKR